MCYKVLSSLYALTTGILSATAYLVTSTLYFALGKDLIIYFAIYNNSDSQLPTSCHVYEITKWEFIYLISISHSHIGAVLKPETFPIMHFRCYVICAI